MAKKAAKTKKAKAKATKTYGIRRVIYFSSEALPTLKELDAHCKSKKQYFNRTIVTALQAYLRNGVK